MAPGNGWSGTLWLKTLFIGLTIVKAGFIVMAFMHLGHEAKFFKYTVLAPYVVFMFYLIFISLNEGTYSGKPANRTPIDQLLVKQQEDLRSGAHHGGGHEAAASEHGAEHH